MTRYRSKPTEIEAYRWDGDRPALYSWINDLKLDEFDIQWYPDLGGTLELGLKTSHSWVPCELGSYVGWAWHVSVRRRNHEAQIRGDRQ